MTRHATLATLVFALLAAAFGAACAQDARPAAAPAAMPAAMPAAPAVAARAADVASVDAIVAALYDVISGPAGKARDWDRFRSLFAPEAKLVAVGARPGGMFGARAMTTEDFIARSSKASMEAGFYEREVARNGDSFGQMVHVFSTYESRRAAGDAKPFQRGINSIQLYSDGTRWFIMSLMWRAEDDKLPLPEHYLHNR